MMELTNSYSYFRLYSSVDGFIYIIGWQRAGLVTLSTQEKWVESRRKCISSLIQFSYAWRFSIKLENIV